jgi:tetratricopeptide (TPR) repeat protein
LSDKEVAVHNRLYAEAWELMTAEIHLHGQMRSVKVDLRTRQQLDKAISLFEHTLELHPGNWNSMWALGKIYQRLDDHSTALSWFRRAHTIEPANADILREASLCAMSLGDESAVELAATAAKLKPTDIGLISNLALALLLSGKTESAREQAIRAVEHDPSGKIAGAVLQLIDDVISGKIERPKTLP